MATDDLRGLRILIVEDESLILLTIQDIVEELGCEVVGTAIQAEKAIATICGRPVDVALLDVNLGEDRTSYPVADALAVRGIPFAFVTGYGSGGVRAGYQDRPVLSKPVDQRSLEEMLRKLAPAARLQEG